MQEFSSQGGRERMRVRVRARVRVRVRVSEFIEGDRELEWLCTVVDTYGVLDTYVAFHGSELGQ